MAGWLARTKADRREVGATPARIEALLRGPGLAGRSCDGFARRRAAGVSRTGSVCHLLRGCDGGLTADLRLETAGLRRGWPRGMAVAEASETPVDF